MQVRIDNAQAEKFVERGWSPTLLTVPRVYGINVLWCTERLREGRMTVIHEEGGHMVADPLTKLRDAAQLFDRGIMCTISKQAVEDSAKAGAAPSPSAQPT